MPADETDVLVVGAGAAGARIARVLAEAGRSVAIVEAGDPRAPTDMVSSQIWARRLKWSGAPVQHAPDDGFSYVNNAGSGTGGAAAHHYACWPRLHEADFRRRTVSGRDVDWPIAYDDLRPWYDSVQAETGVSGDAAAEIWRPPGAPYPHPPLPLTGQGETLRRGFAALGMRTAPLPVGILSEPREGRAACVLDGWCDSGCPIGALYNPLVADLPRALAAGATLLTRAQATAVHVARDRAEAVTIVAAGEPREHRARLIVLANGSVQIPRLLLASRQTGHPDGIGNARGLVGLGFMSQGLIITSGLFPDETEPARGVSAGQLLCQDGYDMPRAAAPYQYQIAPAAKPNDIFGIAVNRPDLHGRRLADFMIRAARHFGAIVGQFEQRPDPANRIALSSETDTAGMKLARVTIAPDDTARAMRAHLTEEGARILRAAGATETWSGPMVRSHMSGGTPMGDDPASSVTDSFGRVHGLRNLVVAGSSLFPTAGAVNPTFTVYALAERAAARVREHWTDYAGG